MKHLRVEPTLIINLNAVARYDRLHTVISASSLQRPTVRRLWVALHRLTANRERTSFRCRQLQRFRGRIATNDGLLEDCIGGHCRTVHIRRVALVMPRVQHTQRVYCHDTFQPILNVEPIS